MLPGLLPIIAVQAQVIVQHRGADIFRHTVGHQGINQAGDGNIARQLRIRDQGIYTRAKRGYRQQLGKARQGARRNTPDHGKIDLTGIAHVRPDAEFIVG